MWTPVSAASVHKKWRPLKVGKTTSITGGLSHKSFALDTSDITEAGQSSPTTFVRIGKSLDWLLKITLGNSAEKGQLKRSRVFEELTQRCNDKQDEGSSEAAVAEDPMNLLDGNADGDFDFPAKKKAKNADNTRPSVSVNASSLSACRGCRARLSKILATQT